VKIAKIFAIVVLVYVVIVVAFESLLGYYQPAGQSTLVITTVDADGNANDRVLSRLESNDKLYVAANHWPRDWYNQVLENPQVRVSSDTEKGAYLAVPVTGEEHELLNTEHNLGIVIRLLTGFPPRYFVRLDPLQ